MNDSSIKRRIWIRNALIIFLAVLLLLTFFSNTIRNRSLPEVSTAYPSWGTISQKVTATGTVRANQTYDVVMEQTRTVASVNVYVGQRIEKGTVLMTLTDGSSRELEEARKTLSDLELSRIEKLRSDPSKTAGEKAAALAALKSQLSEAEATLAALNRAYDVLVDKQKNAPTTVEVQAAKTAVVREKAFIEDMDKEIARLKGRQGQDASAGFYTAEELYNMLSEAQYTFSVAETAHTAAAGKLAQAELLLKNRTTEYENAKAAYDAALEMEKLFGSQTPSDTQTGSTAQQGTASNEDFYELMKKMREAEMNAAQKAVEAANKVLTEAKAAATETETAYNKAKAELEQVERYVAYEEYVALIKDAEQKKTDAEERLAEAEATVLAADPDQKIALAEEIGKKGREVAAQKQEVESLKRQVAEAEDGTSADLDQQQFEIELARIDESIKKQQAVVDKLSATEIGGTVTSPVSGVVASLPYTVGKEIAANSIAAQITLSEAGYTMEVSVSAREAARIREGDTAEIRWYYWGETPTARVVSVKSAGAMSQQKTVVLSVTGQVEEGTSLTVSIGGQDQSYDNVIPLSAVREDQEGKFVLVVQERSTPLGNRYTARRVNVEVITSDATNAAVLGDIAGQYVITASAEPVSDGDPVRLKEED